MVFTAQQSRQALWRLSLFHILIIASSNYLVQLPIEMMGVHTTWGAFSFPFIFLATDLTVRIFGSALARKIILCAMLPALLVSYLPSVLVMNGLFALICYLFIWLLVVRTWLRAPLYLGAPLLFWSVAHFIQNFFAFESIVNYVPFFLIVAFTVWYQINSYEK